MTSKTENHDPTEIDGYRYGTVKDVSWITRLLWYSAGADAQLLARCPQSDRVKYQGLGGVVLSVGFLAFFSGSYAFYAVFSPKDTTVLGGSTMDPLTTSLSVFFGLCWALIIFNLDRFIVSSTGKGDGTDKITKTEFLNSLPRLMMALIIGLCLSKPLEIKILESEIKAQLEIEQKQYLQTLNDLSEKAVIDQRADIRAKLDVLQGRVQKNEGIIEARRLEINEQRKQLELEAEGLSGAGIPGRGPAWRDKKENLDRMEADLERDRAAVENKNQLIIDEINETKAQLAELNEELENKKASNEQSARHLDGLLKRIQISHKIGGLVPYAIMLLLLCIEAGPIFFKLMLSKGAYDYLEENQKRISRAAAGIETEAYMDEKGNTQYRDRYLGVEGLLAEEKRRRDTEEHLANAIHSAYREKKTEDIKQRPEDYVQKG